MRITAEQSPICQLLAKNLELILRERELNPDQLAKKCGGTPSSRYIRDIIQLKHKPTLIMLEGLSKGLKIPAWELLMARENEIPSLLDNYRKSPVEGREYIIRIAEKESKYGS